MTEHVRIDMARNLSETATNVAHGVLLSVAGLVILLRAWIRIGMERRSPILSDWLVAIGWIFALGWVICCAITYRMGALDEDPVTTVPLLKVYFASNYFFDMGLYFPKASLLSLYCKVFQVNFKRLRIALYITMVYVTLCWITAFCLDTLWCLPISNNWSISKSEGSVWNSWAVFRINYAFNVSSDCIVFILPFFLLPYIHFPRRQKWALVAVFSLGLITIATSVSRFLFENFNLQTSSDNIWCTAEMCCACIVVSLPSLKLLLKYRHMRSNPEYDFSGSITGANVAKSAEPTRQVSYAAFRESGDDISQNFVRLESLQGSSITDK